MATLHEIAGRIVRDQPDDEAAAKELNDFFKPIGWLPPDGEFTVEYVKWMRTRLDFYLNASQACQAD